ncbi:MAG: hypothetical protein O2894_12890 [Planctomycetota bacterium]|nr:hypothetical protein [Planctomycetota bacterium]
MIPLELESWAADGLRPLVGDAVLDRADLVRRRDAVDGLTRVLADVRRRLDREGGA